MTSLLLHWLNDELQLHRKVDVLERDLCNGYILAEILHVHGLENHLERYKDAADLPTRVANLELLDKAMAAAGLGELGATTKRQILMESRSSILQVLLRLKDFFESKRVRVSVQQQKLKSLPSRVYEPRSPVKDPARVVQDVEELFIKETANKYRPKEVQFYKEINSAIHLRKFPQAQWRAENELIQYEENMKATNAKQSANSMAALRVHMNDKRTFMKDWDRQHLEKWQHTQKLYLDAERDDLRFELTLEERRRRFHAAKLASSEADAKDGVVAFEKNMIRLGLSTSSAATEAGLRAIPASDPGAVAHLDRLEERVKVLGFRPSNNVQMMKELRARRAAQLAAEKDRRVRRMMALSDSNRIVQEAVDGSQSVQLPGEVAKGEDDTRSDQTADNCSLSIQDAFIDANRDALEANYVRLREVGAAKRDLDVNELLRIRLEKRTKTNARNREDCASIVDDLISLSFSFMENQIADSSENSVEWKRRRWLALSCCSRTIGSHGSEVNAAAVDRQELLIITQTFLDVSNGWEAFANSEHDIQGHTCSSIVDQVELFIRRTLAVPAPDLLDTKWSRMESSKFVAVFTSDERGDRTAREVAHDHSLHYVNTDELLDECVKYSYDPIKQADLAAALGRQERELGVFGPKIASLRQKNSVVPDSLVIEIVVAFISAVQPISSAENDTEDVQDAVSTSGERVGFLLHNFPRTLDEWKLFEKAVIGLGSSGLADEEKSERLASLDSAQTASPSPYASVIACAAVLSSRDIASRTPSPATPGLTPSPSGAELSGSASDRRKTNAEASKRQSVVDPAIAKAEAEQEMLHKRHQVEEILCRTSHMVKIDQENMHERALQELLHLVIDVYTSEVSSEQVGTAVECDAESTLPPALDIARERRRSTMGIQERVAWMIAAKQLKLNEQALISLIMRLRRLEETQVFALLELFIDARRALEKATSSAQEGPRQVDDLLGQVPAACSAVLEKAARELRSSPSQAEKILIAVEVALGDAIDTQRIAANTLVNEIALNPFQSPRRDLPPWLKLVPLVCLEIKEFVVDVVQALRDTFYVQFGFLKDDATPVFPVAVPDEVVYQARDAAKALDQCCHERGLSIVLADEVVRISNQLASATTNGPNSSRYELEEQKVARELATTALRRMTVILRWSTKLVETVTTLNVTDLEVMRRYIDRDLHLCNTALDRTVLHLRVHKEALWPEGPRVRRERSLGLLRHHHAALLSANQLQSLANAFLLCDGTTLRTRGLSHDEFTATVVEVAKREGFPSVWQDFGRVARVALAWSSAQTPLICWRNVVFGLICSQLGEFPTIEALQTTSDQLHRLSSKSGDDTVPTVRRADFLSHTTLWFEHGLLAENDEATPWKALLFSLCTSAAGRDEAEIFTVLFTLCAAPSTARGIRVELASALLPQWSRGLHGALAVLSHWTSYLSSSVGTPRVATSDVIPFLQFAGVAIDGSRLTDTPSWRRDDVASFAAWCDAYDPAIAHRFTVHDTLAALVDHGDAR